MVTGLLSANFPMGRLRGEVDRMMGRVFDELPRLRFTPERALAYPGLNVWEDGENLYAEAELPGIKLKDIEVTVVGDELTIGGERKDPYGDDATFHRRERGFGTFRRVIGLPSEVDGEGVSATLNLGVLRITLPKAEAAKPRKIEVKALTS